MNRMTICLRSCVALNSSFCHQICVRPLSTRGTDWPKIMLLGDSHTQRSSDEGGWGSRLADSLQRKCDVLNRGFNGYTTRSALRFKSCIFHSTITFNLTGAVLFFGTNDSALPGAYNHGHVPLDEYESNLSALVQQFTKCGLSEEQIIMVTPPPADVKTWFIEKELQGYGSDEDRNNSITVEYAVVCKKVAKQHGCRLVNLWDMINNRQDISIYFSDGLHLSKLGNQVLYDALAPHVTELTAHVPDKLPDWKSLD